MSKPMTLNVRVGGSLRTHVAARIGGDGDFENVSEYVRDLIRRDKVLSEEMAFARLKAELEQAFSAPDDRFDTLDAETVIRRNAATEH